MYGLQARELSFKKEQKNFEKTFGIEETLFMVRKAYFTQGN
jgi:hypothetical protein